MNTELILGTNIQNIDTAYGGVRGTTLSSRHNICHWQTVVDSGILTIIELREKDHSDRLCRLCEQYGIRYFAFPMDSHSVPNEVIASRLQEFFELIDNGDFYIACAMGLHRTDMALSIYWMFHGVDNGMNPHTKPRDFRPKEERFDRFQLKTHIYGITNIKRCNYECNEKS